ncbi:MAG: helix-turn-helix domain-containing protein, partial [Candidatus Pacebacteria bacterium]|nr:helix-turn-helix domain-containing protein [Candidatus Paceibacterota bacterium]
LAPEVLRLKKNATVMFVKNNHDKGYVNGTLGTVVDFDEFGYPIVRMRNGEEITATPESWVIEEDGKVLAEVSQVPLRLAWAITVHKSQGMSLDAAEMDLSRSFEPGMGYVALSRVRTLDGLRMLGWGEKAGEVNKEVLEFDQGFKKEAKSVSEWLKSLGKSVIKENQEKFFKNIKPTEKEKELKLSTYEQTKKLVAKKMPLAEMAKERGLTTGAILTHLEKLKVTDLDLDMSYLKPEKKRLTVIKKIFAKTDDTKLAPVRAKLGRSYSYEEIRLGRLFL